MRYLTPERGCWVPCQLGTEFADSKNDPMRQKDRSIDGIHLSLESHVTVVRAPLAFAVLVRVRAITGMGLSPLFSPSH